MSEYKQGYRAGVENEKALARSRDSCCCPCQHHPQHHIRECLPTIENPFLETIRIEQEKVERLKRQAKSVLSNAIQAIDRIGHREYEKLSPMGQNGPTFYGECSRASADLSNMIRELGG